MSAVKERWGPLPFLLVCICLVSTMNVYMIGKLDTSKGSIEQSQDQRWNKDGVKVDYMNQELNGDGAQVDYIKDHQKDEQFLRTRLWTGEFILHLDLATYAGASQGLSLPLVKSKVETIELVVAYCKSDISWLKTAIRKDFPKESNIKITVMSKCGRTLADMPTFNDTKKSVVMEIIQLKNVGGCDYAYAYFIKMYMLHMMQIPVKRRVEMLSSSTIFFLKDTPRTGENLGLPGRHRSLKEMLYYVSNGIFICGVKRICQHSALHVPSMLEKFTLKDYVRIQERENETKKKSKEEKAARIAEELAFNSGQYKNLGDFMKRELNWSFPNRKVTPVCFSGTFAVPAFELFSTLFMNNQKGFKAVENLENLLGNGRDVSIVEHFAERLWASLISRPLTPIETDTVLEMKGFPMAKNKIKGTLRNDGVKGCERMDGK